MTDNKVYTIEATAAQVRLIKVALEFYERIVGLGQVEYLADTLRPMLDYYPEKHVRGWCEGIKQDAFGFGPNESASIGQTPNDIRVCYDMQQAIDKATKHPDKALFGYGNEPWLNIKLKETEGQ